MVDTLPKQLTDEVLAYLGVKAAPADSSFLDTLIGAYGRTVPWESVSRIARRARLANTQECPCWSEEFWQNAMHWSTGGTCFESNRAFWALLSSLGYDGYLTINDMHETAGCHTAIIVKSDEARWLVDVGYPLYAALPIDPAEATERATPFLRYTLRPVAPNR